MCRRISLDVEPQVKFSVEDMLIQVREEESGFSINYFGVERFVSFNFNGRRLNNVDELRAALRVADGFNCPDHELLVAVFIRLQLMFASENW